MDSLYFFDSSTSILLPRQNVPRQNSWKKGIILPVLQSQVIFGLIGEEDGKSTFSKGLEWDPKPELIENVNQ